MTRANSKWTITPRYPSETTTEHTCRRGSGYMRKKTIWKARYNGATRRLSQLPNVGGRLPDLSKPIWNNEIGICYGSGKHGDAPETRSNLRSPWDTLHHGRDWAHRDPNMKDARVAERIIEDIAQHLAKYPPLRSIDQILRRFLEEMRAAS